MYDNILKVIRHGIMSCICRMRCLWTVIYLCFISFLNLVTLKEVDVTICFLNVYISSNGKFSDYLLPIVDTTNVFLSTSKNPVIYVKK